MTPQVATRHPVHWSSTSYGRSNTMAYKHILIAVDLSPESKVLVDKAVSMARPYNAKISLI
ncbi:universal stress protein, partial [Cronobacter sakazakii]|uniref:universal stress protein n=1 Tax=Cronobacter sakazakii TaxID=28141 RepID=UPI001FB4C22B